MKKLNISLLISISALLICAECEKDEISATLPTAAKNYIDQKYPGAEVEGAEQEKDCKGMDIIAVEVEVSEDNEIELIFDLEGKLLFSETEISIASMPSPVTKAISSQFSGYTIKEAERLDMANGSIRYEVALKKGSSTLDVTFDSEGTEICRE